MGFPVWEQLGALLEETLEHVQEMSPSQWPVAFEVIRDIVASFRHQVARIGGAKAKMRLSLTGSCNGARNSCRPRLQTTPPSACPLRPSRLTIISCL